MFFSDSCNPFYFKNYFIEYNEVSVKFMRKNNVLIIYIVFFLAFKWDIIFSEFVFRRIFINNLEKTLPEIIMHFHTQSNYPE